MRIYLAGPDVFTRDPMSLAKAKKELCAKYGFEGVFPTDNILTFDGLTDYEKGLKIAAANEELMRSCDAIIANITPFRGPNMDTGTAYEIGFMRAQEKPVFAYCNVYTSQEGLAGYTHMDRVQAYYGPLLTRPDGHLEDPKRHMMVEDFGMVDNLMIDSAIYFSGAEVALTSVKETERYTNINGFETCLKQAASAFATALKIAK